MYLIIYNIADNNRIIEQSTIVIIGEAFARWNEYAIFYYIHFTSIFILHLFTCESMLCYISKAVSAVVKEFIEIFVQMGQ